MGLKEVLSIQPGSVLWTILTFLVVVFLIGRYGWKPILAGLRAREESIRKDLDTAKSEREKAAALLSEYQATMAGARKDATDIVQKAQEAAAEVIETARAEGRELSQRMVDRAKAEIERDTEAARAELKKYVADLTARATARLVGKVVDARDHEQLILDALKEDR